MLQLIACKVFYKCKNKKAIIWGKKLRIVTSDYNIFPQVWKKYNFEMATKLHRQMMGEFEDPRLVKLVEEEEKKEEKAKRDKEKLKVAAAVNPAKRPRTQFARIRPDGSDKFKARTSP